MSAIRCGNLEFPDIQAIIFDKDGTLEDSRQYWYEVAIARIEAIESRVSGVESRLRKAFGLRENDLNPTGLMAVGSRRDNEIAAADCIGGLSARSIARESFQQVDRELPPRVNPLFPDTREAIQTLAGAGLTLAILSADTTARVEQFVKKNDLASWISVALGSDGERSKPDPLLAIETCDRMGISPARTLMIGDTVADMEMAIRAGAAGAIGVHRGGGIIERSTVTVRTLTDIVARG